MQKFLEKVDLITIETGELRWAKHNVGIIFIYLITKHLSTKKYLLNIGTLS